MTEPLICSNNDHYGFYFKDLFIVPRRYYYLKRTKIMRIRYAFRFLEIKVTSQVVIRINLCFSYLLLHANTARRDRPINLTMVLELVLTVEYVFCNGVCIDIYYVPE